MTPEAMTHIAMSIVMSLAGTVFWFWARGQDGHRREIEHRFEAAGKEVSRLASVVQGLMLLEGRLRLEIEKGMADVRHSVVEQITPQIVELGRERGTAALHDDQIAEIRRRLTKLEESA